MVPTSPSRRSDSPPVALIGKSDAATRARAAFASAAGSPHPVLLEAEPGCRPREIAFALHELGRAGHPLLEIDAGSAVAAAALFGTPEPAAEAELEALAPDSPLLAAGGGTLVLDGLDEMPAAIQRRLARVLRDGEVTVDRTRRTVQCRVVAVAACPPGESASSGRVHAELLRRFRQAVIAVPPLRQRPSDLADILARLATDSGRPDLRFTQAAVTVLAALPWPRNLDELEGLVAGLPVTPGVSVRQEDVLGRVPIEDAFARADTTVTLREARRRFEREYIAAVLERHHWRMSDAARALGIERANLYRKARQLGISRLPRAEAS